MMESRAEIAWSCGLRTQINERTFQVNGNAQSVDQGGDGQLHGKIFL